jgi:hypothetical protein
MFLLCNNKHVAEELIETSILLGDCHAREIRGFGTVSDIIQLVESWHH